MGKVIKTFIFDLGKVIVNFDHSRIVSRIEQFCDFSGVEIHQNIFANSAISEYEIGKLSSVEFFEQLRQSFNLQMSFDDFDSAWNCTFEIEPILSENLIKSLAAKYRLLILSDTNELHFRYIKANFPILKYFDDFVLSYEVGVAKPSPEIFKIAVEKANCSPAECFFTDDREINVAGAKSVGINAVQFVSSAQFEDFLQKQGLIG